MPPPSSTFLLLVLSSIAATAATITWKNPAGGLWSQPTNWQPAQVPGPLDTAVIQALHGAFTVQVNSATTVSNLSLGGPGSNPTLSLAAGILTVSQAGNIHDGAVLEFVGSGLAGNWTMKTWGPVGAAPALPEESLQFTHPEPGHRAVADRRRRLRLHRRHIRLHERRPLRDPQLGLLDL